ncbi:MAG: hypothetical protein U0835_22000 [Isosphaeraceae bacterium]
MDLETTLFAVIVAGLALVAIGELWLLVAAVRVRLLWALGILLFPPLALLFFVRHRRAAVWPMSLIVSGLLLGGGAVAFNRYTPIDLGPREKLVGGETHLTLTGWDRKDYSVLRERPKAVVVQMANPDVTDETLGFLSGTLGLRELDLNGTQVGDAGLARLEGLKAIESLRLRDTKITEEGFQKWLAPREALRNLDLRGTAVTRESGRAWRDARTGRRLMQ